MCVIARQLEDKAALTEGMFSGQRCFIACTGPSLTGFDWSRLAGETVIAMNHSILHIEPTVAITMDRQYHTQWMKNELDEAMCRRVQQLPHMIVRPNTYPVPKDSSVSSLYLATWLGGSPIYLLGCDLKFGPGGEHHFHGLMNTYPYYLDKIKIWMEEFAESYKGPCKIINLNPDSRLRCFEFGNIDEVLKRSDSGGDHNHSRL